MTLRQILILSLLGLVVAGIVSTIQPSPGYIDSDYYFAGGLQLVKGNGFTEPYIWNFLDNPTGLPHPSHAYWMPFVSLLAAGGVVLFGHAPWVGARIVFLLIAAIIPPLTAVLAWSFTSRRDLAFTSGLLAIFPAFYLPFMTVTDTFGPYMILGGMFFLVLSRKPSSLNSLFLGLLAGFMHLTRADGLLWLCIAGLALFMIGLKSTRKYLVNISSLLIVLAGYLMIMAPWFFRNFNTFGTILAPGGSKLLWLTSYDQIFGYPSSQLTFSAWVNSGIPAIIRARMESLGLNLSNSISVQGEVFLVPMIAIGYWQLRRNFIVNLAGFAWILTLVMMTVFFPFAGARGGFFHSGAAMQTIWWVLAPVGLDRVISWSSRKRGWDPHRAGRIFRSTLVGFAALLSVGVIYFRVLGGGTGSVWGQEQIAYGHISEFLEINGMSDKAVVMVANPPGFYLASGNPAIAVPDGNTHTLLEVANRYEAKYIILEAGATPAGLISIYNNTEEQVNLKYITDIDEAHIYVIQP